MTADDMDPQRIDVDGIRLTGRSQRPYVPAEPWAMRDKVYPKCPHCGKSMFRADSLKAGAHVWCDAGRDEPKPTPEPPEPLKRRMPECAECGARPLGGLIRGLCSEHYHARYRALKRAEKQKRKEAERCETKQP